MVDARLRRTGNAGGHVGHRQHPHGSLCSGQALRAAHNHSAIIEFLVDDVDTEYDRIRQVATDFVNEPTTMPWGNRSLLLRDPDGKLVNLFTPATPDAKAKFGR